MSEATPLERARQRWSGQPPRVQRSAVATGQRPDPLQARREQHRRLMAEAQARLRATDAQLRALLPRRAVLAHQDPWFVRRVSDLLEREGVHVIGSTGSGAAAVGLIAGEQPDLALVEDGLRALPGEDVVRELRRICPDLILTARVSLAHRAAAMLEAGAVAVFQPETTANQVASGMLTLMQV